MRSEIPRLSVFVASFAPFFIYLTAAHCWMSSNSLELNSWSARGVARDLADFIFFKRELSKQI